MLPAPMILRKKRLPPAQWLIEGLRKQMVHDLGLCYLRDLDRWKRRRRPFVARRTEGNRPDIYTIGVYYLYIGMVAFSLFPAHL